MAWRRRRRRSIARIVSSARSKIRRAEGDGRPGGDSSVYTRGPAREISDSESIARFIDKTNRRIYIHICMYPPPSRRNMFSARPRSRRARGLFTCSSRRWSLVPADRTKPDRDRVWRVCSQHASDSDAREPTEKCQWVRTRTVLDTVRPETSCRRPVTCTRDRVRRERFAIRRAWLSV